jgi:hypothetical protein
MKELLTNGARAWLCGWGLLLASCATSPSGGDGVYNQMVTQRTVLRTTSPGQMEAAGRDLEPGTRLRLLGMTGEFYEVELTSGERGFVPSRDVGPLREPGSWTGG